MSIRDTVIYVLQTVGQLEGRSDEVADAVLMAITTELILELLREVPKK